MTNLLNISLKATHTTRSKTALERQCYLRTMEVTKDNFFEVLPQIQKSIAECDFMALDLEMTGLTSGKMERQKPWDSAQQRYLKIRDGAQVICPTQFGLCTFKYSAEKQSYVRLAHQRQLFAHS